MPLGLAHRRRAILDTFMRLDERQAFLASTGVEQPPCAMQPRDAAMPQHASGAAGFRKGAGIGPAQDAASQPEEPFARRRERLSPQQIPQARALGGWVLPNQLWRGCKVRIAPA